MWLLKNLQDWTGYHSGYFRFGDFFGLPKSESASNPPVESLPPSKHASVTPGILGGFKPENTEGCFFSVQIIGFLKDLYTDTGSYDIYDYIYTYIMSIGLICFDDSL